MVVSGQGREGVLFSVRDDLWCHRFLDFFLHTCHATIQSRPIIVSTSRLGWPAWLTCLSILHWDRQRCRLGHCLVKETFQEFRLGFPDLEVHYSCRIGWCEGKTLPRLKWRYWRNHCWHENDNFFDKVALAVVSSSWDRKSIHRHRLSCNQHGLHDCLGLHDHVSAVWRPQEALSVMRTFMTGLLKSTVEPKTWPASNWLPSLSDLSLRSACSIWNPECTLAMHSQAQQT